MKQYTYTISWSQPYGQSIDVNKVQKIIAQNYQKLQDLQETLFEKELEKSDLSEAQNFLAKFRVNK